MRGQVDHKKEAALSHERLCELLHYDPLTGKFTWRQDVLRHHCSKSGEHRWLCYQGFPKKGDDAGNYRIIAKPTKPRYVDINIDGVTFRAHRLAWFYMTGSWPNDQIDHEDRDGWNNRWDNLREATTAENCRNRGLRWDNAARAKGIYRRRANPARYIKACYVVTVDGKFIRSCATLAEAKAVREQAARAAHGEFYRER